MALLAVYFAKYLVLFAVHVEIAHSLSGECVLECLRYIARAYSEKRGLISVYLDVRFRFGEFKVYVGHLEYGAGVYFFHETRKEFLKAVEIGRLYDILYGHASAASSEGGLLLDERARFGFVPHGGGQFFGYFHLGAFAGPLCPQYEVYESASAGRARHERLPFGGYGVGYFGYAVRVVAEEFRW